MIKKINDLTFTLRTSIVVHNEKYTNAGISQDEIIKILSKIDGVYRVSKYPINHNVELFIGTTDPKYIVEIMYNVEMVLQNLYFDKMVKDEKP